MSNQDGRTDNIPLNAPPKDWSLVEGKSEQPYETYNIEVRLTGFEQQDVYGIQVFADEYSLLTINMIPKCNIMDAIQAQHIDIIPDHHLRSYDGHVTNDHHTLHSERFGMSNWNPQIRIPREIIVHLGMPDQNADQICVPFIDYLKNCANSKLYPTWPYDAIKANILVQISFILDRIQTKWYPNKGYNFDVTSDSIYDQAFVKNRNLHTSISNIVDEIFNEFIQQEEKESFCFPFTVKQRWDTLNLANQGYSFLDILKHTLSRDIKIIEGLHLQDIQAPYSGTQLQIGAMNTDVRELQEELSTLSTIYPMIKMHSPTNGIFDVSTKEAVCIFQKLFNLHEDGIVGKKTYYKLKYQLNKTHKLISLFQNQLQHDKTCFDHVLRIGDKGKDVQRLQYYMSVIALVYKEIPLQDMDGIFNNDLVYAIVSFQKRFGLQQDGVLGQSTCNYIVVIYTSIKKVIEDLIMNSNHFIKLKTIDEARASLQGALASASQQDLNIPSPQCDGIFENKTQKSVRIFQAINTLPSNGIVDAKTLLKLDSITKNKVKDESCPKAEDSFFETAKINADTFELQNKLNTLCDAYNIKPKLSVDGICGECTTRAIVAFQNMLGIYADGIMHQQSWLLLNRIYDELMELS